jgi:hypothetical protein
MGGPLGTVNYTVNPVICIYDAFTELPVVAPATNFHFPMSQITNLTDASIPPPSVPATEADLPVCDNYDMDLLGTPDCTIAKAIHGMPPGCDAKPDQIECILYLFPAFCGDLSAVRMGIGNVDEEVERCMRAISLGPCVANPGGAACASGLFPGISFIGGGGGSSGKRDVSVVLDDIGSFFLGKTPHLTGCCWVCNQWSFVFNIPSRIGIFKSLYNTVVGIVNFLGHTENMIACSSLSHIGVVHGQLPPKALPQINDHCVNIFSKPGVRGPFLLALTAFMLTGSSLSSRSSTTIG